MAESSWSLISPSRLEVHPDPWSLEHGVGDIGQHGVVGGVFLASSDLSKLALLKC